MLYNLSFSHLTKLNSKCKRGKINKSFRIYIIPTIFHIFVFRYVTFLSMCPSAFSRCFR